jgi:superfamily II DNA or RNA helicase
LSTIYDYLRDNASLLWTRFLEEYPALHQFCGRPSPRIERLLRKPFPAQAIAIMGLAKRWHQARTGMVVAECGTGKTWADNE